MKPVLSSPRRIRLSRLLAVLAPFALLAPLPTRSQEQVIWTPVSEEQAEGAQILVPAVDGGTGSGSSFQNEATTKLQPIVWEVVPEAEPKSNEEIHSTATVAWEVLPSSQQPASDGEIAPPTAIVWEVIPDTAPALSPNPTGAIAGIEEADPEDPPPPEVIAQEQAMPPRELPALPPPPQLQALNRSIAFGDGLVGPDIGWKVPNGFRWSQRWFADTSIIGRSRRSDGEPFLGWNDGDAVAQIHANLLQSGNWSFGVNTSFRSVYQGDSAAGGSTEVGEGISSGFRLATNIGKTGGIAFGGEQIVQWDDKTDTGRNFYLMATKGWWLGSHGADYPLLIANGGFGTGRFVYDDLKFACINNVQNRSASYSIDNDLCWSPIGTISLTINEWWGVFTEYNSGDGFLGASINLAGGIPLRTTWGVKFVNNDEIEEFEKMTWVFRISLGF